ncbi:hypothetical protein [Polynucleobacter necessarius]|uniref:hypothetical protein n=1 Tax=Polynucleobacter necessarius TaxID=576610 RepID=UPI0018D5973C|nr:hypothetical protein [Polynucleobacter necessarius]
MKSRIAAPFFMLALLTASHSYAQQIPIPVKPDQVPGPVQGLSMSKEYVQTIGRLAYIWGYPLVNMYARRLAMQEVPAAGLSGGDCSGSSRGARSYTD